MNARNITSIEAQPNLGTTPAMVNLITGQLLINSEQWRTMKPEHRFFVLLHELGHLRKQTRNELEADEFAFKEYAKRGYPLSESIFALSRNLTFDRGQHLERLNKQWERAVKYDYMHNGNTEALAGSGFVGFNLCLSDKCRKRVNERKANKEAEKTARVEARQGGRTDRVDSRADARETAYQYGIDPRGYISNSIGHVAEAASNILGSGPPAPPAPPANKNKMLLIGGVILVVFLAAIFIMKRK